MTNSRFLYCGSCAKSVRRVVDTCLGVAYTKIAYAESTCIRVTCTGIALVKFIEFANSRFEHVNTDSFDDNVSKRADFMTP